MRLECRTKPDTGFKNWESAPSLSYATTSEHKLKICVHVSSPYNKYADRKMWSFSDLRTEVTQNPPPYLLLDMVSFEAALARPLTPAARAGSMLLLWDCALNLPHVFGFKLARKEDLGDWVVVGLLAMKREWRLNHFSAIDENQLKFKIPTLNKLAKRTNNTGNSGNSGMLQSYQQF